jgi:DNA repair protein RadC
MKVPQIKVKVSITKGDKIQIQTPDDIIKILRSVFNSDTFNWTEEMVLISLNRSNYVIGFNKLASGGFSGVVCDPKVIMTIALQTAASSIILAHNHPSGSLKPSVADIEITKKIKNACSFLDINLLDHIILTNEGYTSMSNECLF